MSTSTLTKQASSNVSMGQVIMARAGETLGTVLGSCIGLVLYHPRLKVGAMAHIVLPDSAGKAGPPGKYADVAIPHMIELLVAEGVAKPGLLAKITGGSRMFGAKGPAHIGDNNFEAVLRILEQFHIPVKAQHVGGEKGRRIIWDPETGDLAIHIVSKPVEVI